MLKSGSRYTTFACFKHSVSRVAVPRFFIFVLMGTYFFSAYHCTPVNSKTIDNTPWWCQPCQRDHRTRHSRGINDPLKDQFNNAINHYESAVAKYVKHLYKKLQIGVIINKSQVKNNTWLPRKRFFQSLKKNNENNLPEILLQIQIFAVTIERLAKMEIRSQDASFDVTERNEVMQQMKYNINLLRCETEHEIAEKQLQKKEEVSANYVDEYIPEAVDHLTEGLLKDYSILSNYQNFLKKTFKKIFVNKKGGQRRNKKGKGDKGQNKKRTRKSKSTKVSES